MDELDVDLIAVVVARNIDAPHPLHKCSDCGRSAKIYRVWVPREEIIEQRKNPDDVKVEWDEPSLETPVKTADQGYLRLCRECEEWYRFRTALSKQNQEPLQEKSQDPSDL